MKLFLQKNAKFSSAGGSAPRPLQQPPHCEFLATRLNQTVAEHKGNPEELWKFINSVISVKLSSNKTSPPLKLLEKNDIIENPSKSSERFNILYISQK